MAKRLDLKDVNIYYGKFHAVADVGLSVPPRSVTAFIGRPVAASPPFSVHSTACTK